MKFIFIFTMVGLSIIVAQTTILRLPLFNSIFYDLLIPLVVFLGLNFPQRQGVLIVVFFGLIMDLLSGGIFGLYLTVYIWIFLSVKNLSKYFDVYGAVFQSVLIGVCVLAQQIIFCLTWRSAQSLAAQTSRVLLYSIIAALTGRGILILLGRLQDRFLAYSSDTESETGDFIIR